jgi:hypothetical protein
MKKAIPIKSIETTTKEEFRAEHRGTPAIIKDGMAGHPAEGMTLDTISDLFGSATIQYAKDLYGEDRELAEGECKLSDFISQILNGPAEGLATRSFITKGVLNLVDILSIPYFCEDWFDDYFSELWKNIIVSQKSHLWLFIGQKGAISGFHQDHHGVHTTLLQVEGTKEIVLFSPEESSAICDVKEFGHCNINKDPDHKEYGSVNFIDSIFSDKDELFKGFQPLYGVLQAGQALYLPSNWGHYVRSLTPSVTFSRDMIDDRNVDEYFCSFLAEDATRSGPERKGHFDNPTFFEQLVERLI